MDMKLIYNKIFLEHDTGMHPENRKRLEALGDLPETQIENGEEYLRLFHDWHYIERVRRTCQNHDHLDAETVTCPNSYPAAVAAVAATVMASRTGDFAVVRPPGHHAHPDRSSGFCIFNNVSIAAQRLVKEGKRVLIFDFDGHLGDGTEKFFYRTDRVMYWSLHQYPAFPGGGMPEQIGENSGEGYTINLPLPAGSGDDIYLQAVKRFFPAALQFKPDVVAVSAGFDAHQMDLLLELRLSFNAYYELGKILSQNFKNIFATLEGGYNIEIFPKCLYNFLAGINGEPQKFTEEPTDSKILVIEEYERAADILEKKLSPHWRL
ncbi:MAG: histone deacetylase family protein [Patescibacteria group bacterium]